MAVTHTGEESLRLLDYLLIARAATSVEITDTAKSLEPLDDTPFGVLDLRVLKLNRLCLRIGATLGIDERPSEDLPTDALAMGIRIHPTGKSLTGAPIPIPVDVYIEYPMDGERYCLYSSMTIWHNEMPRPKTPMDYADIIWSRLGRKELATHLLLQIEELVRIVGGSLSAPFFCA